MLSDCAMFVILQFTIGVGGVFMVISGHHSGIKVWGGRRGIVLFRGDLLRSLAF